MSLIQQTVVPHITPLRIRSASREKQYLSPEHSFSQISTSRRQIIEDVNALDYIGLRANKNHATCNNHHYHPHMYPDLDSRMNRFHTRDSNINSMKIPIQQLQKQQQQPFQQAQTRSQTAMKTMSMIPPKSPQNQNSNQINQILSSVNNEFQRFIDFELRAAMGDLKNDMYEQQFGFERQVCQMLDQFSTDINNRTTQVLFQQQQQQQQQLQQQQREKPENYASQEDLKILENDLIKLASQLEDSLNLQSHSIGNTFNQQQNAIEQMSKDLASQNDQQAEINRQIQDQLKMLNQKIGYQEDKVLSHDSLFDKYLIQQDDYRDDLENQIRTLKNIMNQAITALSNEKTKEQQDYEKKNFQQHEDLRKQIIDLQYKVNVDINSFEKQLRNLENLINQKHNSCTSQDQINDVQIKLGFLEQQLAQSLSDDKNKDNSHLHQQQQQQQFDFIQEQLHKIQDDFSQDQLRQDEMLENLNEDMLQKFSEYNDAIEQLTNETSKSLQEMNELMHLMQEQFNSDQIRQDQLIDSLQQKQSQDYENVNQMIEESLQNHNQKLKQEQEESTQSQSLLAKMMEKKFKQDLDKKLQEKDQHFEQKLQEKEQFYTMETQRVEQQLQVQIEEFHVQNKNLKRQVDEAVMSSRKPPAPPVEEKNKIDEEQINELKQSIDQDMELIKKQINDINAQQEQQQMTNKNEQDQFKAQIENAIHSLQNDIKNIKEEQEQKYQDIDQDQGFQNQKISKLQEDNERKQQEDNLNLQNLNQLFNTLQTKQQEDKEELEQELHQLKENSDSQIDQITSEIQKYLSENDQQISNLLASDEALEETIQTFLDQVNLLNDKGQQQMESLDNFDQKLELVKQNQKDNNLKLNEQIHDLKQNIGQDLDYFENKIVEALQKDTINMINAQKIKPLEKRVEAIENYDQKTNRSPPKVEDIDEENEQEQTHIRLLNELKRKRLWYLRKTPQDYIIEELMLQHRCTQERAEQIYLQQLEKNKKVRTESQSPEGTRNNSRTNRFEGQTNYLGIKSINENIIHAASPNRQGYLNSSLTQTYHNSNYKLEQENFSNNKTEIMRRPISPNGTQLAAEPDYDETEKKFGSPNKVSPSRPPYIIIKSPIHESTTIVTENIKVLNHSNKKQIVNSQLPQNLSINDNEIDEPEESNIDIDELDNNQNQMRYNMNILADSQLNNTQSQGQRNKNGNLNQNSFNQSSIFRKPLFEETQNSLQDMKPFQNPIRSVRNNKNVITESSPEYYSINKRNKVAKFNGASEESKTSKKMGNAQIKEIEESWGSANNSDNFQIVGKPIQYQQWQQEEQEVLQKSGFNYDDSSNMQYYEQLFQPQISESQLINLDDREFEGSLNYDYTEDIRQSLLRDQEVTL